MIGAGFNQFADTLGYKLNEDKEELASLEISLPKLEVELTNDAQHIEMFINNSEHLFDLDTYSFIVKSSVEDFGISGDKYTAFMEATDSASGKIIEKIKEFFKRLWEHIKDYFGKFIYWIKLKERAYNATKAQFEKMDNSDLSDAQIRSAGDVVVATPEVVGVYASALTKLSQDSATVEMLNGFAKYTSAGYYTAMEIDGTKVKHIVQLCEALLKAIESTKEKGFVKFSDVEEYSSTNGVKRIFDKIDSATLAIGDLLKIMDRSHAAVQQILLRFHTFSFNNMTTEQREMLRSQLLSVLKFVSTLQRLANDFYSMGTNVGRVFIKAKQVKSENYNTGDVHDTTAIHRETNESNGGTQRALPA